MDEQAEANARLATKQIRMEINRLLLKWDPLCVKGLRGADRQYESEIAPLLILVKKGANYMEIARHLHSTLTKTWKMPENKPMCVELGKKMYNIGALYRGEEPIKLS